MLAHLLAEDRQPPGSLWEETLFASRLLEYEVWAPLNARGQITILEPTPSVPERVLDAFSGPGALRRLDAPHLASCAYLAEHGQRVALASYDRRMNAVARAMEFPLFDLATHAE